MTPKINCHLCQYCSNTTTFCSVGCWQPIFSSQNTKLFNADYNTKFISLKWKCKVIWQVGHHILKHSYNKQWHKQHVFTTGNRDSVTISCYIYLQVNTFCQILIVCLNNMLATHVNIHILTLKLTCKIKFLLQTFEMCYHWHE